MAGAGGTTNLSTFGATIAKIVESIFDGRDVTLGEV
jgi:hypothetical protein